MSHCAPEATLKPKRFEFTLKTVITHIFVAQVYWKAVPKTWPGGSKASVAKCVVRPWNSTRSVGGRADSTSWTFRNQDYVVSQVRRCLAGQRRVNETCQLEADTSVDRKPVQLTKNWWDVGPSSSSGGILDGLNFADEALRQAVQQWITIVIWTPVCVFYSGLSSKNYR